jgi:hypothetical protein
MKTKVEKKLKKEMPAILKTMAFLQQNCRKRIRFLDKEKESLLELSRSIGDFAILLYGFEDFYNKSSERHENKGK